nr:hypothetical protein CFP56_21792 [Quercus suber]
MTYLTFQMRGMSCKIDLGTSNTTYGSGSTFVSTILLEKSTEWMKVKIIKSPTRFPEDHGSTDLRRLD